MRKPKSRRKMKIKGPAVKGEVIPRMPAGGMSAPPFNPDGKSFAAEVPMSDYYVQMVVRDGSVTVQSPKEVREALEGQRRSYIEGQLKRLGRKPVEAAEEPAPETCDQCGKPLGDTVYTVEGEGSYCSETCANEAVEAAEE